jgi:EAL and modified HD-GYP domain-containing signal transduction protein
VDVFLARQPIFDRRQKVYGYELLFRAGIENVFRDVDPGRATATSIANAFLVLGLESLIADTQAFINMPRDLLVGDYALVLPRDRTVVEILETVEPDAEVVEACRRLKRAGYLLALDDYVDSAAWRPLVQLADIVKVDVLSTTEEQQRALVKELARRGLRLLAEKVETADTFAAAAEMGYELFQGYFFSRPVMVAGRDVPAVKLHYLQLLAALHRPELKFEELEAIVKRDVALSYKLLRYINSAFFGHLRPVESLREALMRVGEKRIRMWASLLAMVAMSGDRPPELIEQAVTRARFCESLAAEAGLAPRAEDLFLLGMFSLIDVVVGRPLAELLDALPVAADVKRALLGEPNALRPFHECAVAYERGDWPALGEAVGRLGVVEDCVPVHYVDAVAWAHASMREAVGAG